MEGKGKERKKKKKKRRRKKVSKRKEEKVLDEPGCQRRQAARFLSGVRPSECGEIEKGRRRAKMNGWCKEKAGSIGSTGKGRHDKNNSSLVPFAKQAVQLQNKGRSRRTRQAVGAAAARCQGTRPIFHCSVLNEEVVFRPLQNSLLAYLTTHLGMMPKTHPRLLRWDEWKGCFCSLCARRSYYCRSPAPPLTKLLLACLLPSRQAALHAFRWTNNSLMTPPPKLLWRILPLPRLGVAPPQPLSQPPSAPPTSV